MKYGVIYPQIEFGSDPAAIRDYAQTAESLGYSFISCYDHVLGANPNRPEGWQGQYTYQSVFQEPFLLFSYMAPLTQKIGFVTGILILPQRQTALVAKQAATLDVLSGGRLRLGVGLGWNYVEFTGLNENFHTRGRRIEEQVQLLRLLWTQPLVTFSGRWHNIDDAGINPLPIQRPIPIWFGGRSDQALKRAALLGDGWILNYRSPGDAAPQLQRMAQFLEDAGRGSQSFGLDARIQYGDGNPDTWKKHQEAWQAAGATFCSLNTMGAGFATPGEHLKAIRRFAEEMGPL